ncbi:MAG: ABC transporter permease, partial [Pseudomonadota bacterium]
MEPLTWTGSLSFLNPIFLGLWALLAMSVIAQIVTSFLGTEVDVVGDQLVVKKTPSAMAGMAVKYSFFGALAVTLAYIVGGILIPGIEAKGIIGTIATRFLPVWIALSVTFALSITFKRRLGLYGKLFDSVIGMIGFAIVMFWVFTAVFGAMDLVVTHDPLSQISGLKNKVPGTAVPEGNDVYPYYLLGGDNLARDVFSRMVKGSWEVIKIAPFATLFAFMVGITLGLPAAYYGGKLDTFLTFLANLILAFPVILLFYLLVTPEIVATGIPVYMAAVLFIFPIVFMVILLNSRFYVQPQKRNIYIAITLVIGLWLYAGIAWNADPLGIISFPPNLLVVFV